MGYDVETRESTDSDMQRRPVKLHAETLRALEERDKSAFVYTAACSDYTCVTCHCPTLHCTLTTACPW
jgi:hypothetical protein